MSEPDSQATKGLLMWAAYALLWVATAIALAWTLHVWLCRKADAPLPPTLDERDAEHRPYDYDGPVYVGHEQDEPELVDEEYDEGEGR